LGKQHVPILVGTQERRNVDSDHRNTIRTKAMECIEFQIPGTLRRRKIMLAAIINAVFGRDGNEVVYFKITLTEGR
jgi:hypothetical protein